MKSGMILLVLLPVILYSKTINNFLNSNSRAMSMAGAFTSVHDIQNSPLWNPSISILEKDRVIGAGTTYSKFELDLVPVGVAIIVLLLDQLSDDSTETNWDALKAVGILAVYSLRGYTYSGHKFQFYFKLNEDLFDYDLLNTKNFFDNSQSMAAFSCQLGREFAAGISLNYYQTFEDRNRKHGLGGSIGLSYNALAAKGLSYGLTYFKFPDRMKDVRARTERLVDNSLNFGLSYNYNNNALVSIDVRDIVQYNNPSFLETHLGLEEKLLALYNGHLYFRQGGFFLNNESDKAVYSLGIGYKSDMSRVAHEKFFNVSLGMLVNRYQEIRNNVFFSIIMSL